MEQVLGLNHCGVAQAKTGEEKSMDHHHFHTVGSTDMLNQRELDPEQKIQCRAVMEFPEFAPRITRYHEGGGWQQAGEIYDEFRIWIMLRTAPYCCGDVNMI